MQKINFLFILILIISVNVHADNKIPIEKLVCYGESTGIDISPDGKFYAALIPSGEVSCDITTPEEDVAVPILVVVNLETMETKQYSGTKINSRVSRASFLNNETLLINRSCARGAGTSGTVDCYTLYGLNVVTGKTEALIQAKQTKSGQGIRYPMLFDSMPQFPNKIIITLIGCLNIQEDIEIYIGLILKQKEQQKLQRCQILQMSNLDLGLLIMMVRQEVLQPLMTKIRTTNQTLIKMVFLHMYI